MSENWQEFTEDTVNALLEDGSDPDAEYTVEHHFYHADFAQLEKLAVEVFKLGFEVTDAEEVGRATNRFAETSRNAVSSA